MKRNTPETRTPQSPDDVLNTALSNDEQESLLSELSVRIDQSIENALRSSQTSPVTIPEWDRFFSFSEMRGGMTRVRALQGIITKKIEQRKGIPPKLSKALIEICARKAVQALSEGYFATEVDQTLKTQPMGLLGGVFDSFFAHGNPEMNCSSAQDVVRHLYIQEPYFEFLMNLVETSYQKAKQKYQKKHR